MIRVSNWKEHQHYHKSQPPWIKVYRKILDDYEFEQLPDADRWLLVGLWLLAARTDNEIPADLEWLTRKLSTDEPVTLARLNRLQTLGFIEVGDSSRASLEQVYTKTETETETETETSTNVDGPSPAVENSPDDGYADDKPTFADLMQATREVAGLRRLPRSDLNRSGSKLKEWLRNGRSPPSIWAAIHGARQLADEGKCWLKPKEPFSLLALDKAQSGTRSLYAQAEERYHQRDSDEGIGNVGKILRDLGAA